MADVTLVNNTNNNGTTTPATPGSITATAGNLLVLFVAAAGTSPTIATPAGWTQIQKNQGATSAAALYMLANNPGGATNPSSTLGGTITGWNAVIWEFSQTGANCALQGSVFSAPGAVTQLPNIFSGNVPSGQTPGNMLFVYGIMSFGNVTLIAQNTGLGAVNYYGVNAPPTSWTSPVVSITNVQGMSLYLFWGSALSQGMGPWPGGSGLLSSAIGGKNIAAWFNTTATLATIGSPIGGNEGIYVPPFYQGMVGG